MKTGIICTILGALAFHFHKGHLLSCKREKYHQYQQTHNPDTVRVSNSTEPFTQFIYSPLLHCAKEILSLGIGLIV